MIEITTRITIDESELQWSFVRSSGPGGQNVNKVNSAAQLRFDVQGSPSLPEDVRMRLMTLARGRIDSEGVLQIQAHSERTQEANRRDALDRLIALIRQASIRPKVRRPTRPTLGSKRRRLDQKRRRSETKKGRRDVKFGDGD